MLDIYIDADSCSVKEEIYKVAGRYDLRVIVVANQYINIPMNPKIQMEVVPSGADAADDWIVEHIKVGDLLITSDIPLASRALELKARVLGQKGSEFNEDNIGGALASRDLSSQLRDRGVSTGGPSSMSKSDRSKFLSKMDQIIHSIKKEHGLK